MEAAVYYVFLAMTLGGALGVLLTPGYVGAAMSMLASMLGVAGLMLMMGAYFPAFVMITVYAGAVLVLFVFVVMLVGDAHGPVRLWRKFAFLALWVAAGAVVGLYAPQMSSWAESKLAAGAAGSPGALEVAKNYGFAMFKNNMLAFQISGLLLLAAMVGVIAVAKEPAVRKRRREMV